ncbi:MAG: peptidylprolyl isomerase [Pseudomonadota bacterium]
MPRILIAFVALALTGGLSADDASAPSPPAHPYVEMVTSEGRILIELDGKGSPYTVDHFLSLVDAGFYNGLVFHRVIPEFMIQSGGYTPGLELKEDGRTIPNESGNGRSNLRGTIAMARHEEPHTANSQFFINVVDNTRLDPGKNNWGYTVFGFVVEGMDVVDGISNVETAERTEFLTDVPVVPVVIESLSRYEWE